VRRPWGDLVYLDLDNRLAGQGKAYPKEDRQPVGSRSDGFARSGRTAELPRRQRVRVRLKLPSGASTARNRT